MSESVAKAAYQQANQNKEDISGLAGDGRTPEQTLKGAYEALENKVDKVQGKGLSTNDYSNEEKQKVADNSSSIAALTQEVDTHMAEMATLRYSTESTEYSDIFSLSPNVVQGAMKGKLKGRTVQNLVKNGNFANGTTGWVSGYSAIAVLNNILSCTGNGSGFYPYTSQPLQPGVIGHRYFLKAKVRVTNSNCSAIQLRIPGILNALTGITAPVQNQWYDIGRIITAVDTTYDIIFYHTYNDAATANGKVMEIQGIQLYDLDAEGLTALTADQLNQKFSHYVDGMQSVQPQEIFSRGKNLFNGYDINDTSSYRASRAFINNVLTVTNIYGTSNAYTVYKVKLKPNTTYRIKLTSEKLVGAANGGGVRVYADDMTTIIAGDATTKDYSFVSPSDGKVALVFYVNGTLNDKVNFSQIQLEEGSTATPYEPYQESKAYMKYPLRSVPNGVADEVDLQSGKLTKRCEEAVIDETWFSKATTNNPVGYDVYRVVNLFTTRMLPAGKIGAADGVTSLLSVDGVGFQRKLYWAQLDSLGQYATEADSNGIINLLVPTGQTFESVYGGKTIRFIYQLAREQTIEDALSNQLTVYPSGTISLVAKKQYVLKAEDVVEMVSEGTYADFARIYITTLTDSMPFKTNVLGQVTLAGRTETTANGYNALENIGKFFVYDATIDFVGVIFPKGTTLAEAQADLAGTIITYDTKPELSTVPTTVHSEPINLAGAVKSESVRNTRQDEQIRQLEMEKFALQQELDAHKAENASKHIKESGSNSNGSYIKFDDGTLFCWNRIPFASGTPTAGGQSEVDWTFPSAFVNSDVSITRSPEVSTSAIDLASNYNLVGRGGNNLVARVILVHLNRTPSTALVFVTLTATGRWK